MNVALLIAGSLGILAASVHGAGGEVIVVRRLATERLPATAFGGPRMTRAMIHATWHMTTVAFFALGLAMVLAGSILDGEATQAVGVLGAAAFTGYAALAVGLGASNTRSPRLLLRHPGPLVLTVTAVFAWVGAL